MLGRRSPRSHREHGGSTEKGVGQSRTLEMNRQLLAGVVVLQLSLSTLAQQPTASPQPQPPPTPTPQQPSATPQQPTRAGDEDVVRINTNLVQVDAVITDKNGKPVIDLKPEEVQISEDGKREKITHF